MSSERWRQISALFHDAQARPAAARAAYLAQACGDDPSLRAEVESLLQEASRPTVSLAGSPSTDLLRTGHAGEDSLIGRRVGPYEVVSFIRGGGMGRVYRARDTKLPRDVALKVLPPEFATAPDSRIRFEREARALATLTHPHINKIFSIEDDGGHLALALELIDGETLTARLVSGALPPAEALGLAMQVAGALAAAHEKGVVHRDLKPANVMIASAGGAQVLDFGLAKLLKPAGLPHAVTEPFDQEGTRTGIVMGTAAYMSPEQARGEEVDYRTDVWSFGCLLYEMLTARSPFAAETLPATLAAVLDRQPDWSVLPADGPQWLQAFLGRCLDKDRSHRFADMGDALRALRQVLDAGADSPAPSWIRGASPSRWRRIWSRWPAWSMAATAVLALGVAVAVLRRPADSAPVASTASVGRIASIAVLPLQNLSGDRDLEFVGDGTTEELISSLTQLRPLRVVSRTSVMSYKTSTKSAATVARELGVDAVLEGAVRGSRDRLRITTQLVNAADDSTLWSKSYEASSGDLLAVQDNIARSVAAVVFPGDPSQASARVRSKGTNAAAYAEILRGHSLRWAGDFGADAQRALEHYRKAVALDPASALAHASLAMELAEIAGSTGIDELRAAAERALALDPELAESHAAMARSHYRNNDWEEGHRESRRAMALSPGSLDACSCFANMLAWTGRDTEALAVADELIARSPRSAAAHSNRGMVLQYIRRHEESLASAQRALALDPAIFLPKVLAVFAMGRLVRADEGVAQVVGTELQKTHVMAIALAAAGRRGEARQLMQEVASATPPVDSIFMAFGYGWLGDKERTISWLTRSVESRESRAPQVIDETFDFVRADPRFEALVRKLKMPSSYYEFLRSKGVGT